MVSEQVCMSAEGNTEAQQRNRESLESKTEQLAARLVEQLPRVSVDKLVDQLADQLLAGKQGFDQDDLREATELATYIANLSNDEKAKTIAADLHALGRDYMQFNEGGFSGLLLGPGLLIELQKLKKDVRAISLKSFFLIIVRFFRGCFDRTILWIYAKFFGIMLAIFLCFPKRQRMSHNNGIAAKGTFKVVPDPKFPPHEFFSPNRVFPLRIRHATSTFLDDAINCIRSLSLKLADVQFVIPFDLQMNTGDISLFWSVTSFFKFSALLYE